MYRRASGEDNDLSYRIIKQGWRISFRPQAKVAHYHPEKLWQYLVQQYRHGFWRAKMYKDHPDMIGGDDYTRLRDRVEPILVLGIVGLSLLVVFGMTRFTWPLFLITALYFSIHISWPISWWLGEGKADALAYGGVTFLRGFTRTVGLGAGFLRFSLKRDLKRQ